MQADELRKELEALGASPEPGATYAELKAARVAVRDGASLADEAARERGRVAALSNKQLKSELREVRR
jgi:hypothetical protein